MDLNQLIKDVHHNSIVWGKFDCPNCKTDEPKMDCELCHGTGEYCDINSNLENIYSKLFSVLKFYKESRFARLEDLNYDTDLNYINFQETFSQNLNNTFESELVELLFLSFDLIGYIVDTDPHIINFMEDESSALGIEEELTYFAIRLEDIIRDKIDRDTIFEELLLTIKRIFYICKIEGIGIKTYIRLSLLYSSRSIGW